MRGGARKGAGRKPTGKTRAPETFSLRLSTLNALEQSVANGNRSGFVDAAICAALERLTGAPEHSGNGTIAAEATKTPITDPGAFSTPQYIAPKPFEII